MKINRFEDIESWKEARLLVADVYKLSCCNDRGFNGQIQRAAISVMSNIAEGFERGSNREFTQYLIIARGSAAEVKSLAYAGMDIGYISTDAFRTVFGRCTKIIGLLNGFISFLKKSDRKK
ncbi:four helix bundle protein [Geotalea uraniireducens]|uniref:four helix bundle protein n=1 Tax=Geotalea uraniireducens TaxID=351604 RepID=UPI00059B5E81|nr:four helix bundle protein [Geotalea uraniireducens]